MMKMMRPVDESSVGGVTGGVAVDGGAVVPPWFVDDPPELE